MTTAITVPLAIRVDEEKTEARRLVEYLHDLADKTGDRRLADAAACLDGYQAGITLATPHRQTGYELRRVQP